MTHLLAIENLNLEFDTEDGAVQAVRGVSLHLNRGETLAVVGESGCGKSVTAMSAMRLIPTPPGRYREGNIEFDGKQIFEMNEQEMRGIRGNDISIIFQEPMTSLNPIFTIGDQIIEAIVLHQNKNQKEAREITLDLLRKVSIPSPESRIDQYPHELSGGMKQRAMIAMAIACRPKLLIADEPTTALDVTIQAQVMELLNQLQKETGMAVLLITHNLGIVAETADRVAVMYAGKIIEEAPVKELFGAASHPYTKGLLNSVPKDEPGSKIEAIAGTVPHPANLPSGCAFHPRCPDVMPHCKEKIPPTFKAPQSADSHTVACWLYETSLSPTGGQ